MDKKSIRGYSQGSPYRNMPYIDINTPEGLIDMSNTDIPLFARDETGYAQYLPPFSGMHKFRGTTVRETPMYQEGGSVEEGGDEDFLWQDDVPEEAPVEEVPDTVEEVDLTAIQSKANREQEYNDAVQIAMQEFPEAARSRFFSRTAEEGESASSGYSAPVGSPSGVNNSAKYAFQYLQQKGIAPHIAAGIVGNLMQESGLRTDVRGDGGQAFGIAQWHPDRQKELFNFSKGKNPYSLDTQLDFVVHEATVRGDLQKVSKAKTSDEAAYLFAKHYERPKRIEGVRGAYARSLHP